MRRRHGECGFTMVETLIALVVLGVVSIALYQVLHSTRGYNEDQRSILEAQQNARVALNALAEDFRQVSYGKDPTQPSIYHADVDSVVFVADLFDNPGAEVISYYLSREGDTDTPNPDDHILMKTVRDTSGVVLIDAPQSYGMAESGLTMRFFNGAGVELSTPVVEPETIGEIQIEVTGVSPKRLRQAGYHAVTLSTTVFPRNLPLSAARSRPKPPGAGGYEQPNCESVTLHWTAPTQNTDGSTLPLDEINHFNFLFGTDPDHLELNARLPRTATEWTVTDLTGETVYYLAVTCVNRSGVESFPYTVSLDTSGEYTPSHVQDLNLAGAGSTVNLSWTPVTTFTDSTLITTGTAYRIYRADYAGFPPDGIFLIGETAEGVTTYMDVASASCGWLYYRVAAVACGTEGAASAERSIMLPALATCPEAVYAVATELPGEILAAWEPPVRRTDGGPLPPDEISHYTIYYGTLPGAYVDSVQAGGAESQKLITGLIPCQMYYVNARATDTCGQPGELCPAREVSVATTAACSPEPPEQPASLYAMGGDSDVQLFWPANTTDCDLVGYRIYYDFSPGAPYQGVGAAEGNSPVTVTAEEVTQGSLCMYRLSGLEICSTYYVVVTAYDLCDPPNESGYSNEIWVETACGSCDLAQTCSPWVASGVLRQVVDFSIHNESTEDRTVTSLLPTWSGGGVFLDMVYANGNLVWKSDGSAGSDGPVGPRPSGATLHPDPFTVPAAASPMYGYEMTLWFTGSMRNQHIEVRFYADGFPCTASGTAKTLLLYDDFDDGQWQDVWTNTDGDWKVESKTGPYGASTKIFKQAKGDKTRLAYSTHLATGNDFALETWMYMEDGKKGFVSFHRYDSDHRHVGLLDRIAQTGNIGRIETINYTYTDIAWGAYTFDRLQWHKVLVDKVGSVYTLYSDCQVICQASIYPMPPGGNFGLGTFEAKVWWDEICIVE